MLDVSPKQDPSAIGWLFELQPSKTWEPKLLDLLKRYPQVKGLMPALQHFLFVVFASSVWQFMVWLRTHYKEFAT